MGGEVVLITAGGLLGAALDTYTGESISVGPKIIGVFHRERGSCVWSVEELLPVRRIRGKTWGS
jgi:hypothetical protein